MICSVLQRCDAHADVLLVKEVTSNTLQHAATRCNILQHAVTCCNTLMLSQSQGGRQQEYRWPLLLCCRLLQQVCCSVLQCGAVCCSVLQCVAVCCRWPLFHPSVLLCDAVCCSMLQHVAACCSMLQRDAASCSMLQYVAVCCCMLRQCVAVR